ncbi:MAG: hypothetical protein N2690_00175 [Rhodocyclaceae bacterium]|nr:hypothetical protein [Rhodocyclaceae bacterium]
MPYPIRQGLHTRKTIVGMESGVFVPVVSTGLYFVVFTPAPWYLRVLIALVFLFVLLWLRSQNKRERDLLRIYLRYMKQADFYEPWPELYPRRGLRPIGFGDRGVLK